MLKLPQLFHAHFLKEGVVHALQQLAARPLKEDAKAEETSGAEGQQQQQQQQQDGGDVKMEEKGGPAPGAGDNVGGSGNRSSGEWRCEWRCTCGRCWWRSQLRPCVISVQPLP